MRDFEILNKNGYDSLWMNFPIFIPFTEFELYVREINFEGKILKLGDICIYVNPNGNEEDVEFEIDAMLLNPSLRLRAKIGGMWYAAKNCVKKIK